jgi:hypothetical protein
MDTLIHADIFFFITSIAVVVLTILLVIAFIYFIQILVNFRDISKTLKSGVNNASEKVEEMLENLAENPVFRFIFGSKTKRKKASKKD